MRLCGLVLSLVVASVATASQPNLDELSGTRQSCATLEHMPAICNFHGGIAAGRNVLSIVSLTLPPISQGGEALRLTVDGKDAAAEWSRWLPYEIQRGTAIDGIRVETRVRMLFEDPGVLFSIELSNDTDGVRKVALGIQGDVLVRRFDRTWEWGTPRPEPKACDFVRTALPNGVLRVVDKQSGAASALAFGTRLDTVQTESEPKVEWAVSIRPHEQIALCVTLGVDSNGEAPCAKASEWLAGFDSAFDAARGGWQARFDAAFKPGNGHFSGCLPLLKTDDPVLRHIYYASIVSWLSLERTNFGGAYPRVFVTASPYYAPTLTYFWDTISYGTLWTLLDPEQVKAQLRLFLQTDIHTCYAIDFLSGKGVGPWYSANDFAVFQLLWTYLRVTKDWAFLDEHIGTGSVLDAMDGLAVYWKRLSHLPGGLADYGTKDNLLETVPTYTNQVASFNAGNVWMMRTLSKIYAQRKEPERAKEFAAQADALAKEILRLYNPSSGWWYCRKPDGATVETRSVVDFLTVGTWMKDDLSAEMRTQMLDAVDKELWSGAWLRALSVEDPSAKATLASPEKMATLKGPWPGDSLRADHGFTGAYDAWPALALETFRLLGRPQRAGEMLRAVRPLLDEGPFGQSHYVATADFPARKAFKGGQDYFEGCGGAFAEVMLRWLLESPEASGLLGASLEPAR